MPASLTTERDRLAASFCSVAEQSFFAFGEAAEPSLDEITGCVEWMEALVHFSGPSAGRFVVTLPSVLGAELCASFLGCGPDEPMDPHALEDLVGELANMACGAWLTDVRRASAFALSHPDVRRVSAPPETPLVWMACNAQPVALTVVEDERPS